MDVPAQPHHRRRALPPLHRPTQRGRASALPRIGQVQVGLWRQVGRQKLPLRYCEPDRPGVERHERQPPPAHQHAAGLGHVAGV
eukprot:scaffold9627_cov123-Isochrysis_galbana.AAC.5